MEKGDNIKKEDIKKFDNKKLLIIIIAAVVVVIFAVIGILYYSYTSQYNSKGVSHFLVVTVDQSKERVKIGRLDDYNVFVEGLSEYNFRTNNAKNLSVKKAIEKNLVSVDEWKKYASSTRKDNDSLILVFDNYEISLTGDECLIRPRS